jgi:dTDP-4-dehydrorhamnose 3,5-epimerase
MVEFLSGQLDLEDDVVALTTHRDPRGELTELFREEWAGAPRLRQWNLVRNGPNVMRGMHVHRLHSDFLIVIEGEMLLALHDIRPGSPSRGKAGIFRLRGDRLTAAHIRPGVVHGFYIPRGNLMVYGLTHGWSMGDEWSCQWDDPALGLDWPHIVNPVRSDRDRDAGTFEAMCKAYLAAAS